MMIGGAIRGAEAVGEKYIQNMVVSDLGRPFHNEKKNEVT